MQSYHKLASKISLKLASQARLISSLSLISTLETAKWEIVENSLTIYSTSAAMWNRTRDLNSRVWPSGMFFLLYTIMYVFTQGGWIYMHVLFIKLLSQSFIIATQDVIKINLFISYCVCKFHLFISHYVCKHRFRTEEQFFNVSMSHLDHGYQLCNVYFKLLWWHTRGTWSEKYKSSYT